MIHKEVLSTCNGTCEGEGEWWGRKETEDRAEMSDNEIIVYWGRKKEKGKRNQWSARDTKTGSIDLDTVPLAIHFPNAWNKIL